MAVGGWGQQGGEPAPLLWVAWEEGPHRAEVIFIFDSSHMLATPTPGCAFSAIAPFSGLLS